jgi:hypothetical protein
VLLASKWKLHDCDDVEALAQSIVSKSGLQLRHDQRESLVTYLVEETWKLSLRYEPERGSTSSFTGWASKQLPLRCIDWIRLERGRTKWQFSGSTYERERPQLVSLDADDSVRDLLESALTTGPGDPAADCDEICARLFTERDRTTKGWKETDACELHVIDLHPHAAEILKELTPDAADKPYFRNSLGEQRGYVDVTKTWGKVRKLAAFFG